MGDRLCPFSVEEAKSLTVPKLKAELIRLNQPVAGLKRKAHFVDALIVSTAMWIDLNEWKDRNVSHFHHHCPLSFPSSLTILYRNCSAKRYNTCGM